MSDHECVFVEEQEPSGRLILPPCIVCEVTAMDALAGYRDALNAERQISEQVCNELRQKLEEMKWALVDALKWGEAPCAECGHIDWQEREVPSTYNTHELGGLPDWLNAVDLHKERIRQLQDALCECPQREFFKASLHDETCPVYVATTSVEDESAECPWHD